MVEVGGAGLLQLPCRAGQLQRPPDFPTRSGSHVAGGATASKPTRPAFVGTVPADLRALLACAADSASAARSSLRRHAPEVGAVCARVRSYGSVRGAPGDGRPYRD